MDNENKKAPEKNGSFKKNRRQKHKGYFIDPSASKEEKKQNKDIPEIAKKPKAQESRPNTQPNAAQSNAQSEKNGEHKSGHRNNRRRHGKRPHNNERNAQVQNAEQIKNVQTDNNTSKETPQNQSDRPHNKHHQKRSKGGHHTNDMKSSPLLRDALGDAPEKRPLPSVESAKLIDPSEIPEDILESPASIKALSPTVFNDDEKRVEIVGVRFKSSGKVYYFDPQGKSYNRASHAIVETARGLEYGEVAMPNTFVKESDVVPPLRPVVRAATQADEAHHLENKAKEDEAFKICNEKIIAHKLDMKLIDAQYTFDNSKLLFYFTSAGRVDFRELVKDLASVFRTRIELRQIGIRDEARLMGGLGLCGRPLCCSLFLNDFGQVSIKMAKEQNLSLNSAKISGICGRLMCCLRYEHETYEHEIKLTPPVDSLVETPEGKGTVTEISPLAATVKVRLLSTPDAPPKTYKRDELIVLKRKEAKTNED
jgi:cell fate regulator YaaT (PSP1 superfamily)